ncbi:glycosyltransferase family 4 protein [Gloeocapsopsis dulcis]|uniref:Glycoside hydrolase n=1 Tax=Gloeocapsopsis dulcis AAB1 = 1H9 TaxID=1433147 RepID=A0A6N8G0S6_9CHRO|nr:glycosyltransferase [Gloeocapsopsis dulcis]MUL39000.1 glycoside hydrolase [Gloeocapsopsis dulcis AAB1 = 1H9]WNN90832.1 glycosyltransferase [Gloeocapsopsis dulcis]
MKIVHIITGLSTGGAEMMLYNLLSQTNRDRFSPTVVSLMDRGALSDRISALDIPVHALGMQPGKLPTPVIFWKLIRTLHQLQPSIIQGWMYHGNIAAYIASLFTPKIPVIWGIHHSIAALNAEKQMTQALIKLGAKISNSPKKIVFVSQTSRSQHEALGYCSQNSCVIPNGFDTALFQPSSKARSEVRTALKLAPDTLLIGLFCRYHPMKDHANFLQAAAILTKKYPVHFLLAGTDVTSANQNLHQLIDHLGLSLQIHLLGERSDIPQLMAALDIATSASAYGEAFPLVVGEAMSCGVPCAVTDVGDSEWIVSNTGKVVPPKNPQALAEAWQELIELGSAGRTALGKAARVRIQENFTLDAIVAQYQALYV